MGILRLFLALSVLSGHCESSSGAPCPVLGSHIWVHGYVAVCGFFIISGFYMAMVLDRKYRANIGAFYLNRAARLAPVYWIVLLLFVVGNLLGLLAAVEGVNDPHSGQQMASLSALIANITLIPAPFAAAMDGFRYSSPWDRLISGQMFTVGLELMFYALVPLLV